MEIKEEMSIYKLKPESCRRIVTACELIAMETFTPTFVVMSKLQEGGVLSDKHYVQLKEYYEEE